MRFAREVLGFEPWGRQAEIMRTVARHRAQARVGYSGPRASRRTAVRSGHGVGKSRDDAALGIWWVCTTPGGITVLTAPVARQVQRALWREVTVLYNSMAARGIRIMPEPAKKAETGVTWPDGRAIFGFTADDPDNISGPSGPDMFVIADEAAGIKSRVWQAIQSLTKGGGPVLATGNPTTTSEWFFEAFEEPFDEDDNPRGWNCLEVSALECPNIVEQRIVVPGLVTQDYIDDVENDFGKESAVYSVRVLGKPPGAQPNAVVGLDALTLAEARFGEDPAEQQELLDEQPDGLTLGCDVARYGDDFSTVSAKRGIVLLPPEALERISKLKAAVNGFDAAPVAAIIVSQMRAIRRPMERVRINVDVGGGYGEGVVQVLRALRSHPEPAERLDDRVTIVSVNSSESASNPDKFERRRDELWWSLREFAEYGAIAPLRKFRREALAPTYALTPGGRIKVESKDETKKKLNGKSPDHADSACLATLGTDASVQLPKKQPKPQLSRWSSSAGRGFG